MKTKTTILTSLLVLFTLLNTALASAQGIKENLEKALGWLSFDLSEVASNAFFVKALFGIVMFAVLYFATSILFKEKKNIAIAISLSLTIISVMAIPTQVLILMVSSYTLVAVLGFLAVPVLAIFYFSHLLKTLPVIKERPWVMHAGSALAYWFLLSVFEGFSKSTELLAGFKNIRTWFGLAMAVVNIMLIYHTAAFIFGIFGGKKLAEKAMRAGAGEEKPIAEQLKGAVEQLKRGIFGEQVLEVKELETLKTIKELINNKQYGSAKQVLDQTLEHTERSNKINELVKNTATLIEKQAKNEEEQKLINDIKTISNFISTKNKELINILAKLHARLDPSSGLIPSKQKDTQAYINEAIKLDTEIVNQTKKLIALYNQLSSSGIA